MKDFLIILWGRKKIPANLRSILVIALIISLVLTLGISNLSGKKGLDTSFRGMTTTEAIKVITQLSKDYGPDHAYQLLNEAYPTQLLPTGLADPHVLAHLISQFLYKQYGINAITKCNERFDYGCFHGFMTALIADRGIGDIAIIKDICAQAKKPAECVHGVGHGIHEWERHELTPSLADCDAIWEIATSSDCYVGVFMANNIAWNSENLANDPWYPCTIIAQKYRPACAASKPVKIENQRDNVEQSSIDEHLTLVCRSAQTAEEYFSCSRSVGIVIARISEGDEIRISSVCLKTYSDSNSKGYKDECLSGSLEYIIAKYRNWQRIGGLLCEKSGPLKSWCMTRLL